jgi:hypothetical protein
VDLLDQSPARIPEVLGIHPIRRICADDIEGLGVVGAGEEAEAVSE